MTEKECKKCGEVKILSNFHKRKQSKDGRRGVCKECINKQPHRSKEASKRAHLKHRYNISLEKYIEIYNSQEGKCKICSEFISIEVKGDNPAVVDHCHKTGKVRGILCSGCNKLLGFAKDQILLLENSIKYLKENY